MNGSTPNAAVAGLALAGTGLAVYEVYVNAIRTCGNIVVLEPDEFVRLVNKDKRERIIIVYSVTMKRWQDKVKLSEYAFTLEGFTFFTSVKKRVLKFDRENIDWIESQKIVMPIL